MKERDASPDYFDSIFDALEDSPADPSPDGPAPLAPVDDALAADAAIQDALESHVALFTCEDGVWTGMPCAFGCRYAEVRITLAEGLVRVSIDTGIRIPAHRRAEANKLVMLENGTFRLSGFEPVDDARDGAVVFSFALDESHVAQSFAESRAARDDEPEGDSRFDALARLLRERDEEAGLALCLALALSTVRGFVPKFNAIAYGGATALETAAA